MKKSKKNQNFWLSRLLAGKNVFSFLFVLFFCLSLVMLSGCEKTALSKSSQNLSAESLSKVEYFVSETEGFIFNNTGDNRFNEFTELNKKELDTYLRKMAIRFGDAAVQEHKDIPANEFYDYFYKLFVGLNEYSQKDYGKSVNKIPFSDFSALFDKNTEDVFSKIEPTLPTDLKKRFEEISYTPDNRNLRGSVACPSFYYGITTSTASSGNRSCTGYNNTKNNGEPIGECDYEFLFKWSENYTPYKLKLYSSDLRIKGILAILGKVNGRFPNDKTVRFLIGNGRVYWTAMTPSYVVSNLKGYW